MLAITFDRDMKPLTNTASSLVLARIGDDNYVLLIEDLDNYNFDYHRGCTYSEIIVNNAEKITDDQLLTLQTLNRSYIGDEVNMTLNIKELNNVVSTHVKDLIKPYLNMTVSKLIKLVELKRYFVITDGNLLTNEDDHWFKENYPESVYVKDIRNDQVSYVPPKEYVIKL